MLEANLGGWRCHCVQLQTSSPPSVQDEQTNFSTDVDCPQCPQFPQCGSKVRGWSLIIMFWCWLVPVRAVRRMVTVSPGQSSAVLMCPRWTAGGNPAAPPRTLSSSLTTSTIWPRHSDTNWTPPSPQCPRSSWTWWCARACSTPWWRAWAAVRCSWRRRPGYNNSHRLTSPLVSPPPSVSSQSFVSQLWQHTWLQYNRLG